MQSLTNASVGCKQSSCASSRSVRVCVNFHPTHSPSAVLIFPKWTALSFCSRLVSFLIVESLSNCISITRYSCTNCSTVCCRSCISCLQRSWTDVSNWSLFGPHRSMPWLASRFCSSWWSFTWRLIAGSRDPTAFVEILDFSSAGILQLFRSSVLWWSRSKAAYLTFQSRGALAGVIGSDSLFIISWSCTRPNTCEKSSEESRKNNFWYSCDHGRLMTVWLPGERSGCQETIANSPQTVCVVDLI